MWKPNFLQTGIGRLVKCKRKRKEEIKRRRELLYAAIHGVYQHLLQQFLVLITQLSGVVKEIANSFVKMDLFFQPRSYLVALLLACFKPRTTDILAVMAVLMILSVIEYLYNSNYVCKQ